MLSFLKGELAAKAAESPKGAYFLLDVHGVGFEVLSSRRSVENGPRPGERAQLFTTLVVREDAMFLVGFTTQEERDLFNILQSASGIGTKVALSLLSALSVSEIAQAVVAGQHTALTRAKGVGSKLAQKMTLELKDKMINWRQAGEWDTLADSAGIPQGDAFREAESVLLSLGYQPDEIIRSFQHVGSDFADASSEVILREALRWLAQTV